MKKLAMSATSLLMASLALSLVSCGGGSGSQTTPGTTPVAAVSADGATSSIINIRYIDGDSVLSRYLLAQDLQEATMRAVQRLDNARNAKAAEIQKFGASIEQKARSNGYLNQQSYEADMQKLQKMQQDAENYIASLSRNADNELGQQQQQLSDTIEKVIREFNESRGYDAILYKNAGVYFNPALDITNEVVDELNARYSKNNDKK